MAQDVKFDSFRYIHFLKATHKRFANENNAVIKIGYQNSSRSHRLRYQEFNELLNIQPNLLTT